MHFSAFFFLILAASTACGSCQARDQTHATTATQAAAVKPDPKPTVPQGNSLHFNYPVFLKCVIID